MRVSASISVILLLALALFSHGSHSSAASTKHHLPGLKWEIAISNYMQSRAPLSIHCKSKDDNLGERTLQASNQYTWEFKENLWSTTLYWCSFSSKFGSSSFQVFWPEKGSWLEQRCSNNTCFWYAKDEGFYLQNTPAGKGEFMHPWGSS